MANDKMSVDLKQISGTSFIARATTGHWTVMDTPVEYGGSNGASTPLELLLMSLAGCASVDVVTILRKMRVPVASLRVEAVADRADTMPKVFTKIELMFHIRSEATPKQVERALDLSYEKHCSVAAMLKSSVQIEYKYCIEPTTTEPGQEA
ncbi:MAG: OsmC family protein [bacterium]|nr:OsmC family protein [bacterium]